MYKIKKSRGSIIFDVCNVILLIFASVITLYPFLRQLNISFSDPFEVQKGGWFLLPKGFSLKAYEVALESGHIYLAFFNSVFVTVVGTMLSIVFLSAIAYPLTKKNLPGQKIFLFMLLFSMIFRGGIIPDYMLMKNLGLLDSLWSLILPLMINGFNIIIIKNFFSNIPDELEEAAVIDGANPIRVFIQIILPLSKPVLATVALWRAVRLWNEFFHAVIYINSKSKFTLPLVVREVINGQKEQGFAETGVLEYSVESAAAATIVIALIPILVVYPFLQKYFTKGIMLGSVKG